MFKYNISNTSLWIVIGFLLVTLVLGLYAGRGIKDIKDYALGGKNFSIITLIISIIATKIGGGSLIGETSGFFKNGIIVLIASLGITIRDCIIAFFIAPKLIFYKDCLTIGDIFERHYGKTAKILCGILTCFSSICIIVLQLISIGYLGQYFQLKYKYVIICISLILGIYSIFGGIKSVIKTDIFQFLVLFIVIPMIAISLLKIVGGYKNLFTNISIENYKIISHKKFYYYLSYFFIWLIFPTTLLDSPITQRALMTNNKENIRNMFLGLSFFGFFFRLIVMIIAFSCLLLIPNINHKYIVPTIIKKFIPNTIFQGISICGILALIISTADSYLHSAGLILFNDIISPFYKFFKKTNEIILIKLTTFIIGIIIVFFALEGKKYMFLSLWALKFSAPILLVPLTLSLIGIKSNKKTFYICTIIGISGYFLSTLFIDKKFNVLSIGIGIFSNLVFYFIIHIIQNKGIAWVQREEKQNNSLINNSNPNNYVTI